MKRLRSALLQVNRARKRPRLCYNKVFHEWPFLLPELQTVVRSLLSEGAQHLLTFTCKAEQSHRLEFKTTQEMHESRIRGVIMDGLIAALPIRYVRMHLRYSGTGCLLLQDAIRGYKCLTARTLVRCVGHYCTICISTMIKEDAWWLVPDLWQNHRWGGNSMAEWHAKVCVKVPALCLSAWLRRCATKYKNRRFIEWLKTHGY